MNKVIWFIDARFTVSDITLQKVIEIATIFAVSIDIIVDKRIRSFERWYLPEWPQNTQLLEHSRTQQNQLTSYVQRSLGDNNIKHRVVDVIDADYLISLDKCLNAQEKNLLIIDNQPPGKRHSIFQQLGQLPCSVLLLTTTSWHTPFKVVAAVDPLHENARPKTLDTSIVKWAKKWGGRLDANWQLIHCCFVPGVFLEHKTAILGIHREGLDDFAKESAVKASQTTLLQGNPENVLPEYIKANHSDLLVIGLVARTRLGHFWVGSTTSALLESPPCDMLLIKT
ncbi:universal stress protein [Teredinibacter purpureus]|uniref:universal stress protein n=1 Tax=Teredinibacter purpureus TaxID=2731756 RepID=UPI0005F874B5|nr:universal stress protein [Teredinibacter purpureus]